MSGKIVTILGIDPGFANTGYAVMVLNGDLRTIVTAGVIQTEKSDKKRKVLATEDNLVRARRISENLNSLMDTYNVGIICAEAMSFPRNSSAAAKVAMCWGIIANISQTRSIPILQSSPQEIKIALCEIKSASKEEIQSAVESKFPLKPLLKKTAPSLYEHAYDAAAAIITGLDSDLMRIVASQVR